MFKSLFQKRSKSEKPDFENMRKVECSSCGGDGEETVRFNGKFIGHEMCCMCGGLGYNYLRK